MINKLKISKRLETVASYLPKGAFFADIGSDHAYLPCYTCMRDSTANAIAGEVNEGPYNSALETVTSYQLLNAIEVRLGNGLHVLKEDEIEQLVIAGMGGSLITSILEDGKRKLNTVTRIIAQPNVDARTVRNWLVEQNFYISNEDIIEENGHIYEIIVADKKMNNVKIDLTDKQLLFGPVLLKKRTKVFYLKWQHEYDKLYRVVEQMKQATKPNKDKIQQFETELKWMKEVLIDETDHS
ncbi:tRNA (adenine(22)-N(1))-methyltransferase [Virgibacillus byunsanensis]|uniref:tRNA (Adenine(22)-N(1))-methyltransferase n=1 Tax=Virgibacillus byunsanensis TaxID=570945 RepID=A0ABW3LL08_9BACI